MTTTVPILDHNGVPVPGMFNIVKDRQAIAVQKLSLCMYFGEKLGLRVPCVNSSCVKRRTMLDVFECTVHKMCTPKSPAAGVMCCETCNQNTSKT